MVFWLGNPQSFDFIVGLSVCHSRFCLDLPIYLEIYIVGSLIPLTPLGGGRDATQSASRGSLVVQYWPDYKVANRLVWLDIVLPSKFLQRHAQQLSDKREKEDVKRNNYIRIKQPIPAAYSEIFFIGGRSILSTTCTFYTRCPMPVFGSTFHHRFSFSCLSENGLL